MWRLITYLVENENPEDRFSRDAAPYVYKDLRMPGFNLELSESGILGGFGFYFGFSYMFYTFKLLPQLKEGKKKSDLGYFLLPNRHLGWALDAIEEFTGQLMELTSFWYTGQNLLQEHLFVIFR